MSDTAPANPANKMAAMLAALWQKNQPQVLERLAAIEAAIAAALDGTMTPELRENAEATAHKLAGSLGMYGFPKGTEYARALELQFSEAVLNPRALILLMSELRETLYPSEPAGTAIGKVIGK